MTITYTTTKMNISPKFHPTHQNSYKIRKYSINNINIYKKHAMAKIMAALWALCLKKCPILKPHMA